MSDPTRPFAKRFPMNTASFQFAGRRPVAETATHIKPERGTFVVAGGFGGPTAGSVAAQRAVHATAEFLEREAGDLDATLPFTMKSYLSLGANVMFNAMVHANRSLVDWNRERAVHLRGGTSSVAAFVEGGFLSVGVLGSAQCYLFRNAEPAEGGLHSTSLILPHTYERTVRPDQRPVDDDGSCVPLRALGLGGDIEPEMLDVRILRGDVFLLTSRPLTSTVMERLVAGAGFGGLNPKTAEAELRPSAAEEGLAGVWLFF